LRTATEMKKQIKDGSKKKAAKKTLKGTGKKKERKGWAVGLDSKTRAG